MTQINQSTPRSHVGSFWFPKCNFDCSYTCRKTR